MRTIIRHCCRIILFFLLWINIGVSFSAAQTIQSTTNGGEWNSTSTWVGGVVPNQNHDVIIAGNVNVNGAYTCNNLTVNSGVILQNKELDYSTITVNANIINNGTIQNYTSGGRTFSLYVKGNVTNNGKMINKYLYFTGLANSQTIGGSSSYGVGEINISSGTVRAVNNLIVDSTCTFYLADDILDMGLYKLTAYSNKDNKFMYGKIKSDGEIDISGSFSGGLEGNFTLVGSKAMRIIGTPVVYGDCKIAEGKIIENEALEYPSWTINGALINYGIIRNNPATDRHLTLYAKGNVVNYGKMINKYLYFSGSTNTQTIGGTSAFGVQEISVSPSGTIYASSDLKVDSTCTFYLSDDILDMGNFRLTAFSNKDNKFVYGKVKSNGEIDVSGTFGSGLEGNFTLVGEKPMRIIGTPTVYSDCKIANNKIIENEALEYPTWIINGTLINNGIIRNYPGTGRHLTIHLNGDIVNNSTIINKYLSFTKGSNSQKIGGTGWYGSEEISVAPSGTIFASSDLKIDSTCTFYLSDDVLNMGNFKLTAVSTADHKFIYGKIYSNGEIDVTGAFGSSTDGNYKFTGEKPMQLVSTPTAYGSCTITEGKIIENELLDYPTWNIKATLVNKGIIRNNPAGGRHLTLYAETNLYNFNSISAKYLYLKTEGNNIVLRGNFDSDITLNRTGNPASGKYIIDDYFLNKYDTRLNADAQLEISKNGKFYQRGTFYNYGTLQNSGTLGLFYNGLYNNQTLDAVKTQYIVYKIKEKSQVDTLKITVVNQIYPTMSSSIKRYWNINGNKPTGSCILTLKYDDSLLNGQDENKLEVFLTPDSGKTWKRISNPANIVRNINDNTIILGNDNVPVTEVYGDLIISSGQIVLEPSISLAIGGRKQIRVGLAPNRYTITYWNNNDYSTGKFFLKLNGNGGVQIRSVESKEILTNKTISIPVDSLSYNGVNNEIYLLCQPLGPKETRSFDIILGAVPGMNKKLELISFTAVALWVGGAILEEFVSNTIVEGCYEIWRPVSNDESLTEASKKALYNSMEKAVTFENGTKGIAKKAAEEVVEKTGRVVAWPVMLAKDIFDCMGNTIKGIEDYLNGNFDRKEKELEKVTSWDPNAKEGPAGYGINGYIATLSPMTYTIFFENKKEATAPAYQVVILDTLDEKVYDINSVEFGSMSHSMGVTSRTGNILKWDFTGIELQPNITPPQGEGWVKFTIKTKPNLPTGTEIKNKAVITFDLNKPIETNIALNTLDFDAPKTEPLSVEQIWEKGAVRLKWNANDGIGSGVQKSVVYMSVDDGPYTVGAITAKDTAIIKVEPLHKYNFYVLSEDNAGNAEKENSKFIGILTDIVTETVLPVEFKLEQNYPNPFNPETIIKYSINKESQVKLDIYNILGQKVMNVIDEVKKAGTYEVKINMRNYSSGVYFYRIITDNNIESKKMLFLK